MDTIRFDPRNHVPEVAPGDVWDDAHGFDSAPGVPVVMLPRKKPRGPAGDAEGAGLRIRAKERVRPAEGEACQLEVREIEGTVMRLDPEVPAVPRASRPVVLRMDIPVTESNRERL